MKECESRIPVEGERRAAWMEGERRGSIERASEPEMSFVGRVIELSPDFIDEVDDGAHGGGIERERDWALEWSDSR